MLDDSWLMAQGSWLMAKGGRPGPGAQGGGGAGPDRAAPRGAGAGPAPVALHPRRDASAKGGTA